MIVSMQVKEYQARRAASQPSSRASLCIVSALSLLSAGSLLLAILRMAIFSSWHSAKALVSFGSLRGLVRSLEWLKAFSGSSCSSPLATHLFFAFFSSFLILVGVRDFDFRASMFVSTSRNRSRMKLPYLLGVLTDSVSYSFYEWGRVMIADSFGSLWGMVVSDLLRWTTSASCFSGAGVGGGVSEGRGRGGRAGETEGGGILIMACASKGEAICRALLCSGVGSGLTVNSTGFWWANISSEQNWPRSLPISRSKTMKHCSFC